MVTFLMILFVILCVVLAFFILLQQGKGDLGVGGMGGSGQMLFGGSGGQNFFEKATWIMGMMFVFGALGLAILHTKENKKSQLQGFSLPKKAASAFPQPELLDTQVTSQEADQSESLTQAIPESEELELDGDDE